MTKRFRPWDPKQKWLLPPEITEFIPEGHPAHFVRDLVVEELDLSAILGSYVEDKGFPPFHPAMMTGLGGLFQQVLVLCRQAGLVALGHVALDGTKVKANASKHKAMSYDRMVKADNEFAEVVKGWLDQAEITDLGEDYRFRNRQGRLSLRNPSPDISLSRVSPQGIPRGPSAISPIRKAGSCPPRTASNSATTPRPGWTPKPR